jgi:hypothetical protein
VENMFTRLLQNIGNVKLLFTGDIPVDKQYHKWYCLKNKEWRENSVMHLPPGSSAQMITHDRVTIEVLINWLSHFTYFQVTSPCMLKSDEATSHQVHSTAGAEECHVITLFCLLSQTTHELQPMDVSLDHFNIIGMNRLCCFTTTTQDHTFIKEIRHHFHSGKGKSNHTI